ncbi:MAG TPA: ferrochelatase [Candidatus Binatia bacterium]|nr:ferrochelatase [Candidatus Binatia bacterium]
MVLPYQAVLLIAFGGPTSAEEIRPFLARVTQGIAIPPQRLEDVARHYEAVGGKSPLNEITYRQARAVQKLLRDRGMDLSVYVGMRNAAPFFVDVLRQMANDRVERALGFILSSHHTDASWGRYQRNVADARLEIGADSPEIDYCAGWHDHPLFIQTWCELIRESFAGIGREQHPATPLVFTAHSVPVPMANRSSYVEQLEITAHSVAEKIGYKNWSIAYQSRSGKPGDAWLEPDINLVIRDLSVRGATDVVIAPIGFVCDHVEVLYDLDIEAKKTAAQSGIRIHRASCPNDYTTFIQMIADVIVRSVQARQ